MQGMASILELMRRAKQAEVIAGLPNKATSPDTAPEPVEADTNTTNLLDMMRKQGHGPAVQMYQEHLQNTPKEDPISGKRKWAGIATAFLEGALGVAPKASDAVLHGAYKHKLEDWQQQDAPLRASAGLETSTEDRNLKVAKEVNDVTRDEAKTKHEEKRLEIEAARAKAQSDVANARTEQDRSEARARQAHWDQQHDEFMRRMDSSDKKVDARNSDVTVHPTDITGPDGSVIHHERKFDRKGKLVEDAVVGEKGNAQSAEKIHAGKQVVDYVDNIKGMLAKVQNKIGPGAGRFANFQSWLGSADPDVQRYKLARQFLADTHAQMFGAKNSERLMAHLEKSLGGAEQDFPTANATLDEIRRNAQDTIDARVPKASSNSGAIKWERGKDGKLGPVSQ